MSAGLSGARICDCRRSTPDRSPNVLRGRVRRGSQLRYSPRKTVLRGGSGDRDLAFEDRGNNRRFRSATSRSNFPREVPLSWLGWLTHEHFTSLIGCPAPCRNFLACIGPSSGTPSWAHPPLLHLVRYPGQANAGKVPWKSPASSPRLTFPLYGPRKCACTPSCWRQRTRPNLG